MTQITANIWWNHLISEGEDNDQVKLSGPPEPDQMLSICKSIAPVIHSHLSSDLIDCNTERFWNIVKGIMAKMTGINPFPDPQTNFPMFVLLFYTFRDNFNPKTIEHAIFYVEKMCTPTFPELKLSTIKKTSSSKNINKKFKPKKGNISSSLSFQEPDDSSYISNFFFHDFIFAFSSPALLIFTFHKLNEMKHPLWVKFIEANGAFERFFDLFFPFLSPLDESNFLSEADCQFAMQMNIYLTDLFISIILQKYKPIHSRRVREIDEAMTKNPTFQDHLHNENEQAFSLFVIIIKSLYKSLFKIVKHSENVIKPTAQTERQTFSSKEPVDTFNYESFHANILRFISILTQIIFDSCDEILLDIASKKLHSALLKESKWKPFFFESLYEQMFEATKVLASIDDFKSNPAGLFNDKFRFYDEETNEECQSYSPYEIYKARRLLYYLSPTSVATTILSIKAKLKENTPSSIYFRIKALSRMFETWPLLVGSPIFAFYTRLFFQDKLFMNTFASEIKNFFKILNRMSKILKEKKNETDVFIKSVLKMKKKAVDSFYNYFKIFIKFAFMTIRHYAEREKYINRSIQFLLNILSEEFLKNHKISLEIKKSAEVLLEVKSTEALMSHFYFSLREGDTKQQFKEYLDAFEKTYRYFLTFAVKCHPFCKNGNHLIQTDEIHLFEPENFIDPRILDLKIPLPERYIQFVTYRNDVSSETLQIEKPTPIELDIKEMVKSNNNSHKFIQHYVSQYVQSFINTYPLSKDQQNIFSRIEDSVESDVKKLNTYWHTFKHSKEFDVNQLKGTGFIRKYAKGLNNLIKAWEKKEYQFQLDIFNEVLKVFFVLMCEIVVHPNIDVSIERLKIFIEKDRTGSPSYLEVCNKRIAIKLKSVTIYNQLQKDNKAFNSSLRYNVLDKQLLKASKLPQKAVQTQMLVAKTSILSGGDVPTSQPIARKRSSSERRVPRDPVLAAVEDFYDKLYNIENCDNSIQSLSKSLKMLLATSPILQNNNVYYVEPTKQEEIPKVEQEEVEKKKTKSSGRKARTNSSNSQDVLVPLADTPQKVFFDAFDKLIHTTTQELTLNRESLQTTKRCLYKAIFDKLYISEFENKEETKFSLFKSSENDSANSSTFCINAVKMARKSNIESLKLPFEIKPSLKSKNVYGYFTSDEGFNFGSLIFYNSPLDILQTVNKNIDYTIDSLLLSNDKSAIDVNAKVQVARAMLISCPPINIIEITKLLAICDFIITSNAYQEIRDIFVSAVQICANEIFSK